MLHTLCPFHPHSDPEVGAVTIPISQIGKVRFRDVNSLAR